MRRLVRLCDLTPKRDAAGRLLVVSNLCNAAEAIDDGNSPFLSDAVAPRGEWRLPSSDELRQLVAASPTEGPEQNELLVVLLPRLARLLDEHVEARAKADFSFVPQAVRDSIDDIVPFCGRLDGLVCQGAWAGPGGLRLVTHDPDPVAPRRIGLHIDNWDALPLPERARGRRRLCANLGLRPRYLVFLQRPISALAQAGELPAELPATLTAPALARAYLGRRLDQLAARVRIDPGEAYIVNADDVFHDGASDRPGAPDLSLHFLGYFRAPDGLLAAGAQAEAEIASAEDEAKARPEPSI